MHSHGVAHRFVFHFAMRLGVDIFDANTTPDAKEF